VYCVSRLRNCIRVRFECPRNFIVDRAKSRILFPAARARAITSERASERERADTRPLTRARYRAETELSLESSRVFHGELPNIPIITKLSFFHFRIFFLVS